MSPHTGTRLFWAIPAFFLAAGLTFAFWPRAVEVDLATVERGPLVATVSETGRTRIQDVFVVSAPVLGRTNRIEVEEGDTVVAGVTVVAEIEPIDPALLDIRTQAEARAAADAARAALALAQSEEQQAQAELDFATADVTRIRELANRGTVSVRAVELAERTYRTTEAALATSRAAVEMRQDQVRAAEARLLGPSDAKATLPACTCIPIRAPVAGTVLRVLQESAGVVAAGAPLLEIGDLRDLEIVVDFVSSDAVRIELWPARYPRGLGRIGGTVGQGAASGALWLHQDIRSGHRGTTCGRRHRHHGAGREMGTPRARVRGRGAGGSVGSAGCTEGAGYRALSRGRRLGRFHCGRWTRSCRRRYGGRTDGHGGADPLGPRPWRHRRSLSR